MPLRGSLSVSLVAHELVDGGRFVMHAKAVNDGGAGLIQAEHLNFCTFATELDDHLIQCCNRSDIPEMGQSQVDGDFVECLLEVENIGELVGGTENTWPTTR